jgi:hypothetical protein
MVSNFLEFPSLTGEATVASPQRFASSIPTITLAELPLVLMPMATSPFLPAPVVAWRTPPGNRNHYQWQLERMYS